MTTSYHGLSRRALLGGAALGFGGVGLAASTGRARAQSPAAKPVTIANASGLASFTMQEVLRQQGFMEEFGLKPETLNIGDGGKIVGGIIGGNIDVSMLSGFAQIFPAIERGAQLKVIAGGGMLPWQAVFTNKPEVRTLKDLETLIPDAKAAGKQWYEREKIVPINHMFVVHQDLSRTRPDVIRELFRMVVESRAAAGEVGPLPPFGVEANRKGIELAIDWALEQRIIPRRLSVDELFDENTASLTA